MAGDVLISAEHLSKRFCRSLKRSLWYGVQGVLHSLNPLATGQQEADLISPVRDDELRQDEFWSLRDVSFQVRRGECLGLIGHNGAGKSTLLKILTGLIRPDRGRITMRGRVGAMIELGAGFNPILTGRENVFNQAAMLGFSPDEVRRKFDAIVDFSEIEHAIDMPLQNYSSGMKIRLGFSVFAQLEPDVLLIDEVLAVGDVGFRMKSLNKMSELMNRSAVIFVTHAMPQVFRVCSEVMLLRHGAVMYQGRDVAAGVAKYFDEFGGEEETITGSGEAVVVGLTASAGTVAASLSRTIEIPYGSDLTVDLTLQLTGGHRSGKVQLLFWNAELLPVLDVMGRDLTGFSFSTGSSGCASICARLPRLLLNAGKYSVSVIVLSEDLKVLCRHDKALSVNVVAACASGASMILPAEWSVRNAS
ncbi:MAG: polysaccharide ABC transporter ATP-binding protein [Planctomycetaceae bacterium]